MTILYRFPDTMRPASVRERHDFYHREFRTSLVQRWFRGWTWPIVFAAVIGRHTKIFPPQYRKERDRTILIDEYETLQDVKQYCCEFRPESVYYDRNVYLDWELARRGSNEIGGLGKSFGQQLAFDIDPENFDCPIHGTLAHKMNRHQGLSFCRFEFQSAQEQALELRDELSKFFTDLRLVYSGRGFHIHVLDEETTFWTHKKRMTLVRSLIREGYLMDEWVPSGGMRLIRLPHSLNGLVSRIATPLDTEEARRFDPLTNHHVLPSFMKG